MCCIMFQAEEYFYMKGAVERVLRHCSRYLYKGSLLPMNGKQEQVYISQAARMGSAGLRGKHHNSTQHGESAVLHMGEV